MSGPESGDSQAVPGATPRLLILPAQAKKWFLQVGVRPGVFLYPVYTHGSGGGKPKHPLLKLLLDALAQFWV